MASPVDFDICGWDISAANLYEAAYRSHVLEPTLIEQLKGDLECIKPMKAILNGMFCLLISFCHHCYLNGYTKQLMPTSDQSQ